MTRADPWVPVAEFGETYLAEFAAGLLRDADIPVLVRGAETGIFGPGFAGATAHGATVYVPEAWLGQARDVLGRGEDSNGEVA